MAKGFPAEIVRVDTKDDITLTGMVIRPTVSNVRPLPIVWIHGYTGNFHEDTTCRLGPELASRGFTFVAGDNRGHDFGVVLRKTGPEFRSQETWLGGAGWEKFSESLHDVDAWISFATAELGFPGVILLGHSYGGTKVVNYLGKRQDPRVKGLIAASPGAHMHDYDVGKEAYEDARKLVAEGRGDQLIGPAGSGQRRISAAAFVDRWDYNLDIFGAHTPNPPVASIRCPLLVWYGTKESWLADADVLELIKKQATSSPRVEGHMIEGADHWYQNTETVVADIVAVWAASL
jgi:pimeloyl-ACP methyl ester carboxylesterase